MEILVGSIGGLQCFQRQCIRFPQQCSEVDKIWPFSSHFVSLCVKEYITLRIECSEADNINICPFPDFLVSFYICLQSVVHCTINIDNRVKTCNLLASVWRMCSRCEAGSPACYCVVTEGRESAWLRPAVVGR